MKILVVCPFVPYPMTFGGAVRVFNLLRHLGAKHSITLIAMASQGERSMDSVLSKACHKVHLMPLPWGGTCLRHLEFLFSPLPGTLCLKSRAFRGVLMQVIEEERPDVLQMEFLPLAHYVDVFPSVPLKVVVEHFLAAETNRSRCQAMGGLRKLLYRLDQGKIEHYEPEILKKYDLCLVTSQEHKEKLQSLVPLALHVSPNGVDTEFFQPQPRSRHRLVSFIGSFDLDFGNVAGATYLIQEIMPAVRRELPQASLQIIGKGLPEPVRESLARTPDRYLGMVPDIRLPLAQSRALLAPLRNKSGTKIRILTAMAMGIPVVAFPEALEGVDARPGEHVIVAHTTQDFVRATLQLLTDDALAAEIADKARSLVAARYDWSDIAKDLEVLYENLLQRKPRGY